jgi:hypothetical protein
MALVRFEPIDAWPGRPTKNRQNSSFRADYTNTLQLLDYELDRLDARSATVRLALHGGAIRRDGWPRSDARPHHPGVVLEFRDPKGEQLHYCDTYHDWQSNLRAIAKTLESLRDIARWGAAHGQQYRGFYKELPAGSAQAAPAPLTRERAAAVLVELAAEPGVTATQVLASTVIAKALFQAATKRCHPDTSGSEERQRRLNEAWGVLQGDGRG